MIDAECSLAAAEGRKSGQNCANITSKSSDLKKCQCHCEVPNGNAIRRPIRSNRIARQYKSLSVLSPAVTLSDPSVPTSSVGVGFSASSHALPRLAHALRSLITSASAKCSPKSGFVDAGDELVYYSNAISPAGKIFANANGGEGVQRQECHGDAIIQKRDAKEQRRPSLQRERRSTNNSETEEERCRNPTTLEQIKALYKSTPNFAPLGETEQKRKEEADGESDRRLSALSRRRDALLCFPSIAHPPPVQPQRKRLLFPEHTRQNDAYFSGGTSGSSDTSLSFTKCVPFQRKKCHSHGVTAKADNQISYHTPCQIRSESVGHHFTHNSLSSCSLNSSTSLLADAKSDRAMGIKYGKKKSSTDSGYRSRGETPWEKQTEPRNQTEGGKECEERPEGHYPPRRHQLRFYMWTRPISADQLRSTAPIRLEALQQMSDLREKHQKEKLQGAVGVLIELLVDMAIELRRLCAVLCKSTCRDVGIVTLLFFPTSLAWHAIRRAQQTAEHFAQTSTDQSKRWQSLSDRSQLRHLNGGLFLRWMIDSHIDAIVDEKVSLFFAAIFDFLLSQLLLHLAILPSEFASASELLNFLANSLPHSRNFHLLSPPIASDGYSFRELSLIIQNLALGQLVSANDMSTETAQFGTPIDDKLCMNGEAILALHHFIGNIKGAPALEKWLKKGTLYALQRHSNTVRPWDVLQAAHLLLPHFDCPPPTASHLFADDFSCRLPFCAASKAVLLGAECHSLQLTLSTVPIDPKMFPEFLGWTPLSWAIALEETQLVGEAIGRPNGAKAVRSEHKHIQIGTSTGNFALCQLLLRVGANPFKCFPLTSPPPFDFPQICPSAFAIAASRGDQKMLGLFLTYSSVLRKQWANAKGFLNASRRPPADFPPSPPFQIDSMRFFASLNELERWAFSEAIYLAAETKRWEVAVKLRQLGVEWPNVGFWMGALEWAMDSDDQQKLEQLMDEFGTTFASELVKNGEEDGAAQMGQLLFRLLSSASLSSAVCFGAARALSLLFAQLQRRSLTHLERELGTFFSPSSPPLSSFSSPSSPINPKFVDSPDLSDIRFRFSDGQIVYGHRILLVNASEEFRLILKKPSGLLEMSECDAPTFRLLLEFVYGNIGKCISELQKMGMEKRMEVIRAAKHFGVQRLDQSAQKVAGIAISEQNFGKVFAFSRELDCQILREECEHFAIGHLAELMSDEAKLGEKWRQTLVEGMKKQFEIAMRETDR